MLRVKPIRFNGKGRLTAHVVATRRAARGAARVVAARRALLSACAR